MMGFCENVSMFQILKKTLAESGWAPLSVLIFYAVAAKGFNAYILFPHLDIPTHFAGGIAITFFFITLLGNFQKLTGHIPYAIILISSIGLTASAAIIWEFFEYASDYMLNTEMNLGTRDTLSDLFFGLSGAFAVCALAFVMSKKTTI